MTLLIHKSKKLIFLLYSVITMGQFSAFTSSTNAWLNNWIANKTSIVLFSAVNTTITISTEYVSRSIWPIIAGSGSNDDQKFFVTDKSGSNSINRQSLVSILMTLFASLLGGPVYFIRKRRHRFMFFVGFGTFNSIFSQFIGGLILTSLPGLSLTRLLFDVFYNGSLKYSLFEISRSSILKFKRNIAALFGIRISQDLLTTFLKVASLNILGLKGS